jgi:glycosidase
MNYPFRDALVDFFAKGNLSSQDFLDILVKNQVIYREEITMQLLNLLDSHDTPRFLTESRGNKQRLKLATAFQLLYKGVPYLYYGDEVGLMGGNDPLCRGTMVWEEEKQDLDLLQFFKQMIRIRKNHEVLTFGDFKIEQVEEKSFSFSRVWPKKEKNEEIFILFNMGHEPSMLKSKAGKYKDLLSNKVVNLEDSITVEPLSFNVYGTMGNELELSDK